MLTLRTALRPRQTPRAQHVFALFGSIHRECTKSEQLSEIRVPPIAADSHKRPIERNGSAVLEGTDGMSQRRHPISMSSLENHTSLAKDVRLLLLICLVGTCRGFVQVRAWGNGVWEVGGGLG